LRLISKLLRSIKVFNAKLELLIGKIDKLKNAQPALTQAKTLEVGASVRQVIKKINSFLETVSTNVASFLNLLHRNQLFKQPINEIVLYAD